MRAIANLIWFVLGGCIMGLGWWLAGLIMLVSIVVVVVLFARLYEGGDRSWGQAG